MLSQTSRAGAIGLSPLLCLRGRCREKLWEVRDHPAGVGGVETRAGCLEAEGWGQI